MEEDKQQDTDSINISAFPITNYALGIAGARFGSLFRAIFRWRIRFKRAEKSSGGRSYLLNGCQKRCFIGFRWLVKTTHFTHKLQRG